MKMPEPSFIFFRAHPKSAETRVALASSMQSLDSVLLLIALRRYRVSSAALLRHFKDTSLDKITADEVERFKTARVAQFTTVRGKDKRKVTRACFKNRFGLKLSTYL